MTDLRVHDQTIARIQHFADLVHHHQIEKEIILLTMHEECCEKEKLKNQILLCEELLKEYYKIFDDILYK